jgi:hypothetical protein
MFFISWGKRGKLFNLGSMGQHFCAICQQERGFNLYLTYTVCHIMWVFRWVIDKKYTQACEICNRGQLLDSRELEASLPKNPVSKWDTYGWVAGVGIIALIIISASISSAVHEQQMSAYLAAPRVGDMFSVDFSKMGANPTTIAPSVNVSVSADFGNMGASQSNREAHGIMKIVSITDAKDTKSGEKNIEFAPSNIVNSRISGVERDINTGVAAQDSYYGPFHMIIPFSKLKQMANDRLIENITRQ